MRQVIDANCWRLYVDEQLEKNVALGHKLFEPENNLAIFLFDEGLLMRQQYIALKVPYSEQLFDHWFERNTLKGQVAIVDLKAKTNLNKELNALGVPKGEHVYFRVAVHGAAEYLISLDSDFYHPKKKLVGAKEKAALIRSGKGPVCTYMKKQYEVVICCPEALIH